MSLIKELYGAHPAETVVYGLIMIACAAALAVLIPAIIDAWIPQEEHDDFEEASEC